MNWTSLMFIRVLQISIRWMYLFLFFDRIFLANNSFLYNFHRMSSAKLKINFNIYIVKTCLHHFVFDLHIFFDQIDISLFAKQREKLQCEIIKHYFRFKTFLVKKQVFNVFSNENKCDLEFENYITIRDHEKNEYVNLFYQYWQK